jgi:hypothetical protein
LELYRQLRWFLHLIIRAIKPVQLILFSVTTAIVEAPKRMARITEIIQS